MFIETLIIKFKCNQNNYFFYPTNTFFDSWETLYFFNFILRNKYLSQFSSTRILFYSDYTPVPFRFQIHSFLKPPNIFYESKEMSI